MTIWKTPRGTLRLHILQQAAWIFTVLILVFSLPAEALASGQASQASTTGGGPRITDIRLNLDDYSGGRVPRYGKLEITFSVQTAVSNPYLPFDPSMPNPETAGSGISIDAYFSPDGWRTVYTQPAFFYQEFLDEVRNKNEWFYPTGGFSWKVRFAPHLTGRWEFRLVARDRSGQFETAPQAFEVSSFSSRGFVRVSGRDPRYFEFDNGDYFPALGYNMNYDNISWNNPVLENEENFRRMAEGGVQLVRMWLSQWGIYGPSWNPWNTMDPERYNQYIPSPSLTFTEAYPGSDVSMRISQGYNTCMFLGYQKAAPAVKPNTTYRVRVRYKTVDIDGPRQAGKPYGLVAKTGGWLWGEGNYCYDSGVGTTVTPHVSGASGGWQILEGSLKTGDRNYLPNFFLVLENAKAGTAYIDHVWIEEDLGGGQWGPNIVPKPWMAHHLYMEQRNSYAFDKVVSLAEKYGVYLRPVLLEKEDWIFNSIDFAGQAIPNSAECKDEDPKNDPAQCPGVKWFYGDGRNVTKVRWLQMAWWRYVQARWGYSTAIHSWELLNEGDPALENHFLLADELGRYMHSFYPNDHLVSTSFWHSFPGRDFWSNPAYSQIDFADIHKYIDQDQAAFSDTAQGTFDLSMEIGARQPGGAGKPVIRGETGFVDRDGGGATGQFNSDPDGIWLHNFIWGGINSGGLIESYWYDRPHIYQQKDGEYVFDHRDLYRAYHNFIRGVPLNHGSYQDAEATTSDSNLKAWGQKDTAVGRAHLWISNKKHTWKNAGSAGSVSGKVTVPGFQPGKEYQVEWWDPYQPALFEQVKSIDTVTAKENGSIVLKVEGLRSDLAVHIYGTDLRPPTAASYSNHLFMPLVRSR